MDLHALLEIIRPRKFSILLTGLVFATCAFFIAGIIPLRYASTGLLMLDAPRDETLASMARTTDIDLLLAPSLLTEVATTAGLYQKSDLVPALRLPPAILANLPATLLGYQTSELLEGRLVAAGDSAGSAERDLPASMDDVVAYLRDNLKITGDTDSRVLAIRLVAGDPALAAKTVNDIMARYVAADYAARQAAVAAPIAWLTTQLGAAQKDAVAADVAVLAFQKAHNFSSQAEGSYADINLNREWDLLSAAKAQLADAQLAQNLVRSGFDDPSSSSPQIQSLRERQLEASQRLAAAEASMGAGNLTEQELRNEMQSLHRQMAAATSRSADALAERVAVAQARVDALQAELSKAAVAAAATSENQFELQQLVVAAQGKHAVYDNLLGRLHDAQVAANQVMPAQVVSPATMASEPEPTHTALCVMLGFLTGCVLAATAFIQRHLLNARVGSVAGLTDLLQVPNLGCLPLIGSRRGTLARLALDQPHSAIAETLRGIRLRLQHWGEGPGGRVVLVTSAERGEGKTSVAAALALRAAGDGVRVLLMEGDLHRPSLAQDLKMNDRSRGLEAAITGKLHREKFLEIHAETQLHCLFARASVPNAIALLDSGAFSKLIEEARSIYDLIVIDGPPVLRVPDPLVLSRLADRIVWVVRAERTPQRMITEAMKRFPADRRAVVATILTGAPKRMLTGFGFYAGYSGRGHLPALAHDAEWIRPG